MPNHQQQERSQATWPWALLQSWIAWVHATIIVPVITWWDSSVLGTWEEVVTAAVRHACQEVARTVNGVTAWFISIFNRGHRASLQAAWSHDPWQSWWSRVEARPNPLNALLESFQQHDGPGSGRHDQDSPPGPSGIRSPSSPTRASGDWSSSIAALMSGVRVGSSASATTQRQHGHPGGMRHYISRRSLGRGDRSPSTDDSSLGLSPAGPSRADQQALDGRLHTQHASGSGLTRRVSSHRQAGHQQASTPHQPNGRNVVKSGSKGARGKQHKATAPVKEPIMFLQHSGMGVIDAANARADRVTGLLEDARLGLELQVARAFGWVRSTLRGIAGLPTTPTAARGLDRTQSSSYKARKAARKNSGDGRIDSSKPLSSVMNTGLQSMETEQQAADNSSHRSSQESTGHSSLKRAHVLSSGHGISSLHAPPITRCHSEHRIEGLGSISARHRASGQMSRRSGSGSGAATGFEAPGSGSALRRTLSFSAHEEAIAHMRAVLPADVIKMAGYPAETYEVTTQDGYILTMQRIPRHGARDVAFFMHGVLDTSLSWVSAGVTGSTAFAAWDMGMDVWLGNSRCNEPRMHIDPKKSANTDAYWRYSINEMGEQDCAAQLEFIHNTKIAELGMQRGGRMMAAQEPVFHGLPSSLLARQPSGASSSLRVESDLGPTHLAAMHQATAETLASPTTHIGHHARTASAPAVPRVNTVANKSWAAWATDKLSAWWSGEPQTIEDTVAETPDSMAPEPAAPSFATARDTAGASFYVPGSRGLPGASQMSFVSYPSMAKLSQMEDDAAGSDAEQEFFDEAQSTFVKLTRAAASDGNLAACDGSFTYKKDALHNKQLLQSNDSATQHPAATKDGDSLLVESSVHHSASAPERLATVQTDGNVAQAGVPHPTATNMDSFSQVDDIIPKQQQALQDEMLQECREVKGSSKDVGVVLDGIEQGLETSPTPPATPPRTPTSGSKATNNLDWEQQQPEGSQDTAVDIVGASVAQLQGMAENMKSTGLILPHAPAPVGSTEQSAGTDSTAHQIPNHVPTSTTAQQQMQVRFMAQQPPAYNNGLPSVSTALASRLSSFRRATSSSHLPSMLSGSLSLRSSTVSDALSPAAGGGDGASLQTTGSKRSIAQPNNEPQPSNAIATSGLQPKASGQMQEPYRLRAVAHSLGGMSMLIHIVQAAAAGRRSRVHRLILLTPAGFHVRLPFVATAISYILPVFLFFTYYVRWIYRLKRPTTRFAFALHVPTTIFRTVLFKLLADVRSFPSLAEGMRLLIKVLLSNDASQWDRALQLPHYGAKSMPAVSCDQLLHLTQCARHKCFQLFDYGSKASNAAAYGGSTKPPNVADQYWRIGDIPVDLVAGAHDGVIPPSNVRLHHQAMKAAGLQVTYKEFDFGHLDFTFGVKDDLKRYVLRLLRKP